MKNQDLDILIKLIAKLPGLGQKSAKRAVLHLLENKEELLSPLIHQLDTAKNNIQRCIACNNLDTSNPCHICMDATRDQKTICVVEQVVDVWAMERTGGYRGLYHILGGTLSALDGVTPDDLAIGSLLRKVSENGTQEVIIALKATVDGQTTAHYLADRLSGHPVKTTRLAHGMPLGGELDYMDDGTIMTALKSRQIL